MIKRGIKRRPSKSQQAFGRLSPAQRAAMEKSLAAYMILECGHMTTREAAILYSVFATNIKDVFCDKCGDFRRLKAVKDTGNPDDCICPVNECLFPNDCHIPF